ncbi:DUF2283 domain-containing protein [Microbacterium sp.]|uniref:DUF2283 domain-containing protein n=1 Tax=Microbacterium sp. TaxID=51671 RepID=UPI0027336CA8|nr:DUF2283 domain-containing protein [Microbacterium sp.]MDP3949514.1 DUF2283 domain-containing protein [Microbacterium sp.]
MDVRYDGDSDAVRIDLMRDGEQSAAARKVQLASPSGGTFVFDYDDEGTLLSVGFEGASKIMDPEVLGARRAVPDR